MADYETTIRLDTIIQQNNKQIQLMQEMIEVLKEENYDEEELIDPKETEPRIRKKEKQRLE